MSHRYAHLLPFGATVRDGQRTNFRIWAPGQQKLYLEVDSRPAQPMQCRADGWFELDVDCDAGECYRYRLADGLAVPDPASRAQTDDRSEEHTSELQSLMRISYAVFCLTKKKNNKAT